MNEYIAMMMNREQHRPEGILDAGVHIENHLLQFHNDSH